MSSSPIHPHTYEEVDLAMGYTLHCGLCWLPGTKKWVEFILTSKSSEVRYKLVLLTNFFKSCLGKWTQKDEQYGWLRIWGFLVGFSFFGCFCSITQWIMITLLHNWGFICYPYPHRAISSGEKLATRSLLDVPQVEKDSLCSSDWHTSNTLFSKVIKWILSDNFSIHVIIPK